MKKSGEKQRSEMVPFFSNPEIGLQIIETLKKNIEQAEKNSHPEADLKRTDLDKRLLETLHFLDNFPLTASRKRILKIWLSTDLSRDIKKINLN